MNAAYQDELESFKARIKERSKTYIGYPAGVEFKYEALYELLNYALNNVGDPYVESYDMQTKSFERQVVAFFADLFNAPKNNYWGYVTGGGSEGNLFALYLARELYPQGMVYYSEATHYSVQKNLHLLGMDSIVIRTQQNGEMDYEDLKKTVQHHRHRPVIVLANIGTTMTEAKDDVACIRQILKEYAIKSSYIHCDAALAGVYLPLVGYSSFDFSHGADSIAISGHKFLGTPVTCGVVVVKKSYKDRIGRSIAYIGSLDTTITGSRNGITPLFLWYAIRKWGAEGLNKKANACLAIAKYAETSLNKLGIQAWRNPLALTVVLPKPAEIICQKWQLATEGEWSHIICMPGVTKDHITQFVQEVQLSLETPTPVTSLPM